MRYETIYDITLYRIALKITFTNTDKGLYLPQVRDQVLSLLYIYKEKIWVCNSLLLYSEL